MAYLNGSYEPSDYDSISFIRNINGKPVTGLVSMPKVSFSSLANLAKGTVEAEALDLGGGHDTAFAGDGDDWVDGGSGNDVIHGEAGHDDLRGGIGADTLYGGQGNDVLDGGADLDRLVGGAGDDLYRVYGQMDTLVELPNEGADTVYTSLNIFTLPANIERLVADLASFSGNATFTGNAGHNQIYGGNGNDVIDGGAGVDLMAGGAGNDVYRVDNALDHVVEAAGQGRDTVQTSLAFFVLPAQVENLHYQPAAVAERFEGRGNELDNVITGGSEGDFLYGLDGHDTLDGGAGTDYMFGGKGNDVYIVDKPGFDGVVEVAGEGIDTIRSDRSATALPAHVENLEFFVTVNAQGQVISDLKFEGLGNDQDNRLTGWSLSDTLAGGGGHDQLFGLEGGDYLTGDAGNDTMDGGSGADTMFGYSGDDVFIVDNAGDQVNEMPGQGWDTVRTDLQVYAMPNSEVEALVYTGASSFQGTGNSIANYLIGNGFNDQLHGGGGNDTLVGNGGNDTLNGGEGADVMHGGSGNDTYLVDDTGDVVKEIAGNGIDSAQVWAGIYTLGAELENAELKGGVAHRLIGNAGGNSVVGDIGSDTVFGLEGDDSVLGQDGKDSLYGGAGHDTLRGGNHDDQLLGESGNDYLYGDAGNDVIIPATGFDQIWGGSGADRFVFGYVTGQSETDVIHDFQPGVDKLDFSSIDGRAGMAGDQPLAFAFMGQLVGGGQASLNYHFSGGNTVVHVDADGDGNADLAITLIGQTNFLALSDLML